MDTAEEDGPPPSYEVAVQMESSHPRTVIYGAAREPAKDPLISDSPHESDDEETILLKAELRRLREEKLEQKLEQKKRQLGELIGRERTYSGTGIRPPAAGMSGVQSCGSPLQYQPQGYSSTPQIMTCAPSTSNTVFHPVAVAHFVPPPVPVAEENKGPVYCGKHCCCCFIIMIGVAAITILLIARFSDNGPWG